MRFVQIDADVAEKLGLISEILTQLCPETRPLPPCDGHAEDRADAQTIITGCKIPLPV
ncbi:hypothetical protein IVA88_11135 [Bradyrhizobium sp. 149]|uniref:hypothetical protein n=1 Tax=Bradyrhizobium sp. 149 TaxID=2782624 RepID=UPI001FF7BCE5|nr:hypothetical protein [Bradyrhizobium sp. 149]MCK1651988.1 hypothetical protein [Bradyrhizobium sp. 149]